MEDLLNKIEIEKAKHLALLKKDGGLTRQNIEDYNALCKLKKNLLKQQESKTMTATHMSEYTHTHNQGV